MHHLIHFQSSKHPIIRSQPPCWPVASKPRALVVVGAASYTSRSPNFLAASPPGSQASNLREVGACKSTALVEHKPHGVSEDGLCTASPVHKLVQVPCPTLCVQIIVTDFSQLFFCGCNIVVLLDCCFPHAKTIPGGSNVCFTSLPHPLRPCRRLPF